MIERFDDVEVIPGLLPLLRVVQRSHMQSRERSKRLPGNEATPSPRPMTVPHVDSPLPFPSSYDTVPHIDYPLFLVL